MCLGRAGTSVPVGFPTGFPCASPVPVGFPDGVVCIAFAFVCTAVCVWLGLPPCLSVLFVCASVCALCTFVCRDLPSPASFFTFNFSPFTSDKTELICRIALHALFTHNWLGSHVSVTAISAVSSTAPSCAASQSSFVHLPDIIIRFCAFAIGLSVIASSRSPEERNHSPTLLLYASRSCAVISP